MVSLIVEVFHQSFMQVLLSTRLLLCQDIGNQVYPSTHSQQQSRLFTSKEVSTSYQPGN